MEGHEAVQVEEVNSPVRMHLAVFIAGTVNIVRLADGTYNVSAVEGADLRVNAVAISGNIPDSNTQEAHAAVCAQHLITQVALPKLGVRKVSDGFTQTGGVA